MTALKALVFLRSGSSAMLAETIHTLIDTANQALLALGLRQSQLQPNQQYQYGYGRAAFVWGMISALGMLWAGGGTSIFYGLHSLMHPSGELALGWENWAVLSAGFAIDGAVLFLSMRELLSRTRDQFGAAFASASIMGRARLLRKHMQCSADPFLMAVALEDAAACTGVLVAGAGIGMAQVTGSEAWDAVASISIGGMLTGVAVALVRLNMRYLLGHAIDDRVTNDIDAIIRAFPSIDAVRSVNTQYLGPTTFIISAKVDFDGTYVAARLWRDYEELFTRAHNLQDELPIILSFFAEDVTRVVEKEVRAIEAAIRKSHPGAVVIELEPNSCDLDKVAGLAMTEARVARSEAKELLQHQLAVLAARKQSQPGDANLQAMEQRLQAWYRRRMKMHQEAASCSVSSNTIIATASGSGSRADTPPRTS